MEVGEVRMWAAKTHIQCLHHCIYRLCRRGGQLEGCHHSRCCRLWVDCRRRRLHRRQRVSLLGCALAIAEALGVAGVEMLGAVVAEAEDNE